MKKKTVLVVVALVILSIVAAGAYAVGFGGKVRGMFSGNDKVKTAIETGDYHAYTQAIESDIKSRQLTEEQFNKLAERYKAEAPMRDAREKAQQAIENNDYSAWSEAMNSFIESQKTQITQENFENIVKMRQEMKSNDSTMMHGRMNFSRHHFSIGNI